MNHAWQNIAGAIVAGVFVAIATSLIVMGGFRALGKPPNWLVFVGNLVIVSFLVTIFSPSLSRAQQVEEEAKLWNKIVANEATEDVNPYDWEEYERRIPPAFQRPERDARRKVADALYSVKHHEVSKLRTLLLATSEPADVERFAEAREVAHKELSRVYAAGVAKLRAAPLPVDGTDIVMDPALRKAFATLLEDLATAPDSRVMVAFDTHVDLTPPKGTDANLSRARRELFVSKKYPNANAPVIDAAEALRHDSRRTSTLLKALNESFKEALDPDLLSFALLQPNASQKGSLVLEVTPTITRTADFTPLESSTEGKDDAKISGLLIDFVVHWRFAIRDRSGKELYRSDDILSSPAEHIHADTGANDPDWAMYSVLIDSAYYGFSRQLTGRFGLAPPAPRERFKYEP